MKKEWDHENGGIVFTLSCGHTESKIAPPPWKKTMYCAKCESERENKFHEEATT